MFTQFEEGRLSSETHNLLSETQDDTESGDKSYDNSALAQLSSEEEMDAMSSGDESDDEPMSTEMLQDIREDSQYHMTVNSREACYKIIDHIKRIQAE